jgi:hypothetical protein
MLVFWKERLVFLAVPKTGTTAIEGALAPKAALVFRDPPILKHTPLYRYRRLVEPYLMKAGEVDLETIAVIRHPVDWLGSWYRYRRRDDLAGHPNSTREISFDDFVVEYTKGKPAPFADVGSQAKFLASGGEDKAGVDHLFHYEDQPRMLAFFEERFGEPIALKRLNVSPPMALALKPETLARLEKKRIDEFEAWEKAGR